MADDLKLHHIPYYFEAVAKTSGGWSANTLQKAGAVLRAMDRHPAKRIILLDVDCRVTGDLAPLASLPCDVALFFMALRRKHRFYWLQLKPKAPPARLQPRSGTMLFAANATTRSLVETWVLYSRNAKIGDDDECTLAMALAQTGGLTVHILDVKWAGNLNMADAVIMHDSGRNHQIAAKP